MSGERSRKQTRKYRKHRRKIPTGVCEFCDVGPKQPQFVSQTKNFKIIRNLFPYSVWDSLKVAEHLLIIPKQHTDTLSVLNADQAQEFVRLISDYENKGYSVYARAPGSKSKTVIHQHTHLIKLEGRVRKVVFTVRRPYIRITF